MIRGALLLVGALVAIGCGNDERVGTNIGSAGSAGNAGSAGSGGTPMDAGADAGSCLSEAQGLAVADVDLDGFPSYALDGCELLYVAAESQALVHRDLVTGAEQLIAESSEAPRRPSIAAGVMAWEADAGGKSVVRVRVGADTQTLDGSFDHAGEPRACADAVVFTGWLGATNDGDSDVFLYAIASKKLAPIAAGAGQQRFADVSLTHVAASDFSEDPGGIYTGDGATLANVIVIDRKTGASTRRELPGKQAFPMLGSPGVLSYLEWITVHPVPKLQEYSIQAVPLSTPSAPAKLIGYVQSEQAVRPTARAGLVEWVVRWNGASSLWRAALDGSSAPVQVTLGGAAILHAPVASDTMTVLAAQTTIGAAPELWAVPRE